MPTPYELVKEVSRLLEDNHLCYVEKQARKIHAFPLNEINSEEIAILIKQIEEKIERYIKIEKMPTQKLLFIMEDFLTVVTDHDIKKELSSGLKRKNPTRNFLQILDARPDINQHWRLYKKEKYEEYVGDAFIDDYNY